MLKRIYDRFLYDPKRHARRLSCLQVDAGSVILPSTRFQFHGDEVAFVGSIRLGKDSMVGCNFVFESAQGQISIGERTFINSGTSLIARTAITIGSDVTIAWGCTVYDHNSHSLDWRDRADDIARQLADHLAGCSFIHSKDWSTVRSRPITIGDKAWIGFDCIILSGVTIGEGAVVGAGSVVREDVEPWTVVAGNPAVPIKKLQP